MAVAAEKDTHAGMELEFRHEVLVADLRGCMFWPSEKALIVSDLHLEKGSSFASRKGIFMPPYDTQATLEALALCVHDWQPRTIISLGDSFHDDDASLRLPQSCRLGLRQLMEGRDWIWVCGNHDPTPPDNLGGTFCTEIQIGPLNFIHEPTCDFRHGEVAGHLHPSAKIRRRNKSVRRRCFVGDENRMILPAFGAFTGGLNVLDPAYDGLFEMNKTNVWLLGQSSIYRIPGRQLVR